MSLFLESIDITALQANIFFAYQSSGFGQTNLSKQKAEYLLHKKAGFAGKIFLKKNAAGNAPKRFFHVLDDFKAFGSKQ